MSEALANLLTFYGELGRPLTAVELWRFLPEENKTRNFRELLAILDKYVGDGTLKDEEGFYSLKKFDLRTLNRKKQDLLLDKKWKRLVKLARAFRFLPFINFVMVNGSMALGTVTANSDFDVLIGVREGRIFTSRYLTLFLFTLLGARRLDDSEGSGPDKLCFNHFVTRKSFSKPPRNFYRRELYKTMIPIYGNKSNILKFIEANAWSELNENAMNHLRYAGSEEGIPKIILKKILGGRLGDFSETFLKSIAARRLSSYVKKRAGGRVVVSDTELEFHFNLTGEARFSHFSI